MPVRDEQLKYQGKEKIKKTTKDIILEKPCPGKKKKKKNNIKKIETQRSKKTFLK